MNLQARHQTGLSVTYGPQLGYCQSHGDPQPYPQHPANKKTQQAPIQPLLIMCKSQPNPAQPFTFRQQGFNYLSYLAAIAPICNNSYSLQIQITTWNSGRNKHIIRSLQGMSRPHWDSYYKAMSSVWDIPILILAADVLL